MNEHEEPAEERRERRRKIREWYTRSRALGISEEEFFRQLTPVMGDEEIEAALAEMEDDA